MTKARLVITAIVLEHRPVAQVAAEYGVSRSWAYKLLARYRQEGESAFDPRTRRPHGNPHATAPPVIEAIIAARHRLAGQGLDAGAHTIAWHLATHHHTTVAPATIWRVLKRAGLIEAQPKKRPRTSYLRFEAEMPNQMWQTDFTHYPLADGTDIEVLTFIDDHSRRALSITAHRPVTGPSVVTAFRETIAQHGIPATVLSDNGLVYTARFRGSRSVFEHELRRLEVAKKNSHPNHPQTCGKVERFQQTMKKWLRQQPPPATIADLQHLLDSWQDEYNNRRPHRSLGRRTPAAAYQSRPKSTPTGDTQGTHGRIRYDRIDTDGKLTLRHDGHLHHIGIGRTHARTPIIMLIQDLQIRVVHALTGELLRELTLDTTRDYQPQNPKTPRT